MAPILSSLQKTALARSNYNYHAVNLLLWGFVAACLVIVRFTDFHVQCIYKQAGVSCASCGLTTSFRQALHGKFSTIPKAFLLLFLLFASQILLRLIISVILSPKNSKIIGIIDSVFHIILGILCTYTLYAK